MAERANHSDGAHTAGLWQPRVTALVPCYNAAEFIERTFASLEAQTWPHLDVLIGDDASTDDTAQLCEAFATRRPGVRVLRRDRNLGWLLNTNDLMAKANGELMFFAFHDDVVAPTYVERLVDALRDNTRAVIAFSDMQLTELDGTVRHREFDALTGVRSPFARGFVMAKRPRDWSVPNRGLFRSWAFQRIGGIKPNDKGEYSADWTWLLHMALLGEFVRVPEVLVHKYYMKGSISKQWPHDQAQRAALRRAGIREIRDSPLGVVQRAVLVQYLRSRDTGWRRVVPRRITDGVKRLAGLP
jgi:GT2 family glycosyltransferase